MYVHRDHEDTKRGKLWQLPHAGISTKPHPCRGQARVLYYTVYLGVVSILWFVYLEYSALLYFNVVYLLYRVGGGDTSIPGLALLSRYILHRYMYVSSFPDQEISMDCKTVHKAHPSPLFSVISSLPLFLLHLLSPLPSPLSPLTSL